jgi:hypothetical protein
LGISNKYTWEKEVIPSTLRKEKNSEHLVKNKLG